MRTAGLTLPERRLAFGPSSSLGCGLRFLIGVLGLGLPGGCLALSPFGPLDERGDRLDPYLVDTLLGWW